MYIKNIIINYKSYFYIVYRFSDPFTPFPGKNFFIVNSVLNSLQFLIRYTS